MRFETNDVLSVVTGKFYGDNGMAGIKSVLNFMIGKTMPTSLLAMAARGSRPVIYEQYPILKEVGEHDSVNEEMVKKAIEELGESIELVALPEGYDYRDKDFVEYLNSNIG
jgi:hypothetical protein